MNKQRMTLIGKLAKQLCKDFPSFQTKDGAYNKCKFASLELARVLKRHGIDEVEIIHYQGIREQMPDAHDDWLMKDKKDWTHYAVRVAGQVMIDPTARQFFPKCEVPLVEPASTVVKRWVTVEVDTFLNAWLSELVSADLEKEAV